MVDESVKFAWAYLLEYGKLTNGRWSYYGGRYEEKGGGCSWDDWSKERQELKDKVVSIGIDWNKTGVPEVSNESEFMDTESPSRDKLATLGTLYLKNGESFKLGSGDNDAAHLAETAKKIIQGKGDPVTLLAAKL
jgi:hypothetical protein